MVPATQDSPDKREIRSLTGLRGIAAIHVVIFHYFLGLPMSNPVTTFISHGYLAVDLFFVLSGFVMALNYSYLFRSTVSLRDYGTFLGRRLARVYPLYAVTTVCALLLLWAGWLKSDYAPHWADLISNLFMVQAWGFGESLNGPGWSISTEWAAYLLFPLLLVPASFRGLRVAFGFGALCVGGLLVLCLLPTAMTHNTNPVAILDFHDARHGLSLCRCIPEFSLGMTAFRFSSTARIRSLTGKAWPVMVLSCLSIVLLAVPRADLLFVLTLPFLLIALSNGEHLPQRILGSAPIMLSGVLSYSIYLVHQLLSGVLNWTDRAAARRGLHHAESYAAAVCMVLTLLLAWPMYQWIEAPGRRWLRKVFGGAAVKPVERAPSLETGMP